MTASRPAAPDGLGPPAPAELAARVRRLLVSSLHLEGLDPDSIGDEQPLFGPGLGLDSVDALELVVALEREFSITVHSEEVGREAFGSVRALTEFLTARLHGPEDPRD